MQWWFLEIRARDLEASVRLIWELWEKWTDQFFSVEVSQQHFGILKPVTFLLSQLHRGKQDILNVYFVCNWFYCNTSETSMDWLQPSTDLTVSGLRCGRRNRAAPLNPAACCDSDPALSDGRSWNSELRSEKHSWFLTNCSPSIWRENKLC